MNYKNLPDSLIRKLVDIAIESNPAEVARVMMDYAVSIETTTEVPEWKVRGKAIRAKQLAKLNMLIGAAAKVEAIKFLRTITGCGLKEAKDIVDSISGCEYFGGDRYWVDAAIRFRDTGVVVLSEFDYEGCNALREGTY